MAAEIDVEVVFAIAAQQRLVPLTLQPGATVADAIEKSGLAREFAGHDLASLPVGIWGHLAAHNSVLSAGDRVEIYRPLQMDPREARRRLAAAGQTMRKSDED
jgi:putative ubiquitin-RnfH superfamily antitoxin RatB of RatAB toxin-antitoxin module